MDERFTYSDTLRAGELWVIECCVSAVEANFQLKPHTDPAFRIIRADFLRRLILNLPVGPHSESITLTGMGVRLRNAIIEGHLNLEHGSLANGEELPRLSLPECQIKDGINLKSAKLRRLCLKDAQISELQADHVHISGLLDIRGLRQHPDGETGLSHGKVCHLSLRGAHIEDGIDAAGACLVAPPPRPGYVKYSERAIYALDLPEAQINGDVRLFPDFKAYGGVNLNGAIVIGSVQAHGAHLTDGEMYGLDASGAKIYGNLSLDSRTVSQEEHSTARIRGEMREPTERFTCKGQVRLHNIIIDEDLRMYGARITGERGRIAAEHITVRGDVCFCAFDDAYGPRLDIEKDHQANFEKDILNFECDGRVDLRGAGVGGDVNFKGARLHDELDLCDSRIGGHLLFCPQKHREKAHADHRVRKSRFERFQAKGQIKLSGTEVTGNLTFEGADLFEYVDLKKRLLAHGLKVNGFANFAPFVPEVPGMKPIPFEARGIIILDNGVIAQKLDMSGARLHDEFIAPNLQVGGKLLMCAFVANDHPEADFFWFEALQRVTLSGADIRGDFDMTGARLHRGLRFRGGKVSSALIFDIHDVPGENVLPDDRRSIDLFNAQTNVLSDLHAIYKNGTEADPEFNLAYGESYFLRLEGFNYARFPHYADDESLGVTERKRRINLKRRLAIELKEPPHPIDNHLPKDIQPEKLWALRMRWLNHQYRGVNTPNKERMPTEYNYNPDPYNRLYKFYKSMGAQYIADRVLLEKLTSERKTGGKFRRNAFWLIEKLFDYGLNPTKASIVYFLFIAFCTIVILFMNTNNYLDILSGHPHPDVCIAHSLVPAPLTFVFETVIPSFDANERADCSFSFYKEPWWQFLKLVLGIVGWMMTSMTVLTWTGLLRRNLEP